MYIIAYENEVLEINEIDSYEDQFFDLLLFDVFISNKCFLSKEQYRNILVKDYNARFVKIPYYKHTTIFDKLENAERALDWINSIMVIYKMGLKNINVYT